MPNFEKWSGNVITMQFVNSLDELHSIEKMCEMIDNKMKSKVFHIKIKTNLITAYSNSKFKSFFVAERDLLHKNIETLQLEIEELNDFLNKNKPNKLRVNLSKQARELFGVSLEKATELRNQYKIWCESNCDKAKLSTDMLKQSNYMNFEEIIQDFQKLKI